MKPHDGKRLEILIELTGLEGPFLSQCVEYGVIRWEEPEGGAAPSPEQLARLRRLRRLCRDLDVDVFAGSIIVDLLERMEAMRR